MAVSNYRRNKALSLLLCSFGSAIIAAEIYNTYRKSGTFEYSALTATGLGLTGLGLILPMFLNAIAESRDQIDLLGQRIRELSRLTGVGESLARLQVQRRARAFWPLANSIMRETQDAFRAMSYGSYVFHFKERAEAYSERFKDVLNDMLEPDTTFRTVTNCVFWSKSEINRNGEYMRAMINSLREQPRLKVLRVFVLPPNDSPEWAAAHDVLEEHLRELKEHGVNIQKRCKTKVHICSTTESYDDHFERGRNFAVWSYQGVPCCIVVRYSGNGNARTIESIEFTTTPSEVRVKRREFDRMFSQHTHSTDLNRFMDTP